jgi:GT2 family glycosyltransferase
MISIITPTTRGGLTYLASLVPTVEMQTAEHELIVVDNASRDGTSNYLGNHDCIIKVNSIKMNFSQSNNYGATLSHGDYLLFLNNDTFLQPNLLEEMLRVFEIDEKIGVVGCQLRLMSTNKVHHAGIMYTDKYEPYELGLSTPFGIPELPNNDPRITSTREVPSVTSACMMVKKNVFYETGGGFDEKYIFGWEDVDFNLKVKEKGYKIYYTGRSFAHHKHFGGKDQGRFRYEKENRARYEEIWMNTGRAKAILGDFREA